MPGKRISSEVIQLVYYNHLIGKGVGEIMKMFCLQRQTVYNIIKRAKNEKRLELKFASGRPRKITGETESLLLKKVEENPYMSVSNLSKLLKVQCGVIVSPETIRQALNRNKCTSSAGSENPNFSIKENKVEINEKDAEELIRLVYSRPVLWDQKNENYFNAVLIDENWQSVAEALKQPKELCKKKWENTCEQFGNELNKIPMSLLQGADLSEEQYDAYTTWPYFKSLLFLKNHMSAWKPAGYCSQGEDCPDTSNEVNLVDSFSESDEYIPDQNSDRAAEVLANEQRKLELQKKEVSVQKDQRDDDNAFFDSLIPYMKTMDMHQKMLCRIELQRTVYNYSLPAATIMPDAPHNSSTQMVCFAEDSKMNIVDIKEEPKDL